MCYPEYKKFEFQTNASTDDSDTSADNASKSPGANRSMMKAPLVNMRLGDLYGAPYNPENEATSNKSAQMVGFLKSLSYTFPDNSPWEIQNGYRVPKYIEAAITFQVIHSEVPSLEFALKNKDKPKQQQSFYGINQTLFPLQKSGGRIKRKPSTGI